MILRLMKPFIALMICASAAGCGDDDDGADSGNGSAGSDENAGRGGSDEGGPGAGSSDAGTPARGGNGGVGSAGDMYTCAQIKGRSDELATELGCAKDRAILNLCNAVHDKDICIAEFDAMVACLAPFEAADYRCHPANNEITPKDDVCGSELEAFDACGAMQQP